MAWVIIPPMRAVLSFLTFLVTLAVLAGAGGFLWGWQQYAGPGSLAQETMFAVEKGQGVSAIAGNLASAGIIKEPLLFKAAARLTGNHTRLKAGEYQFAAHVPMSSVLGKIAKGESFQRRITVREGLTSWQVAQILNAEKGLAGEVLTAVPAEGSLLPETYSYERGETRADKIAQMQKAMEEAVDDLWYGRADNLPLVTRAEAVILASIVEKETGAAGERARIAGVFINRLRRSIPLQTDPTVIYALTEGKMKDDGMGPLGRRLLRKDMDIESPYNTYKNPGLPPGPICNPGRGALEAVLNPEPHDYLYFVADGTGGHVFAETLDEHNRNAEKWRIIRKQQGN